MTHKKLSPKRGDFALMEARRCSQQNLKPILKLTLKNDITKNVFYYFIFMTKRKLGFGKLLSTLVIVEGKAVQNQGPRKTIFLQLMISMHI